MRRFISYGPALVVLMTVVAVLMSGPTLVRRIGSAQTSARIVLAQRSLDDDDILERINKAVRTIATTVEPSVVHIEVTPSEGRRFMTRSTGSGWVFDGDGHIVTNAHVVRGGSEITVQFSDGHIVKAEPINGQAFVADPFTDIAVIKVPADSGLFPMRRATGVQPQQGDRIFVFGSPFGFKFSMSQGIVSGLGRDPQSAAEYQGFTNFIQTDAAVNPGNSGGPLVDIKGRIIGMNVAIATGRDSDGTTDAGQSAGISFAIPLGTIETVVNQLIDRGEVRRGFLGIQWPRFGDPTVYEPAIKASGVRIGDVTRDGPAFKGGLKAGDVIMAIAGQPTPSLQVLRSIITTIQPGATVQVRAVRDGKPEEFNVTLAEFPAETQAQVSSTAALFSLTRYGLSFSDRRRGVSLDDPPTLSRVMAESAAESAGFEAGDKIVQVAGVSVETIGDVCREAAGHGLLIGSRVPMLVIKGDEQGGSTAPRTIEVQVLR